MWFTSHDKPHNNDVEGDDNRAKSRVGFSQDSREKNRRHASYTKGYKWIKNMTVESVEIDKKKKKTKEWKQNKLYRLHGSVLRSIEAIRYIAAASSSRRTKNITNTASGEKWQSRNNERGMFGHIYFRYQNTFCLAFAGYAPRADRDTVPHQLVEIRQNPVRSGRFPSKDISILVCCHMKISILQYSFCNFSS